MSKLTDKVGVLNKIRPKMFSKINLWARWEHKIPFEYYRWIHQNDNGQVF